MTLSAEALLLLALLAFYAKDCLLLLHANEAILERRDAQRWNVEFGSRNFTLAGRQPCLLHPLMPHRPVYRLRWTMTDAVDPLPDWSGDAPRDLLRAAGWAVAIALALFGMVPLALLGHASTSMLLAAVALVYALILAALLHAWLHRETLGLSSGVWASLAGELLLCPPYAVNLVRRLSLHASPAANLLAAARTRLDPDSLAVMHRECAERIRLELELEDENTPRSAALASARAALVARAGADD